MRQFLLFLSFLSSAQTFAVGSISVTCSSPDGSFTEAANINITGDKVSVKVTEGPYATSYIGNIDVSGAIFLQGSGECGRGVSLTMDPELIDGSEASGYATLVEESNYGCEGSTSEFTCKAQ